MDCTQAGKDTRVLWNPEVEALKPFQGPMRVAHHIIYGSYLHKHKQQLANITGHACKNCSPAASWYMNHSSHVAIVLVREGLCAECQLCDAPHTLLGSNTNTCVPEFSP